MSLPSRLTSPRSCLTPLFDVQLPWFAAFPVDKQELVVLVAAMIDSNNHVVRTGDVARCGDGLVEEGQLGELAALNRKSIDLHAAGVVTADEELTSVSCDVRDDRASRLNQARQEIVDHVRNPRIVLTCSVVTGVMTWTRDPPGPGGVSRPSVAPLLASAVQPAQGSAPL